MPTYTYINKKTGEETSIFMSISEKEKYDKKNPHLEQTFTAVNIIDPITAGVRRPPRDFSKYVLGKVKEMPGANKDAIEKRFEVAREI